MPKLRHILLLTIAAIMLVTLPVYADESDIPSLFAGDEAWYKDSVSPLIIRDGVCFIPADLFAMLDGISVTTPKDNNLLIHNTSTGSYISILFMQRSAAVNGKIVEDISVFRNGDTFYVDAAAVSDALGLVLETQTLPNGGTVLRISDENRIFTIDELIDAYLPDAEAAPDDDVLSELPDEEDEIFSYDGKLKRIYVLVKSPVYGSDTEFPAIENCKLYGVNFTHFLDSESTVSELLSACAMGTYGIVTSSDSPADALDSLNSDLTAYTRRTARFTLSDGVTETDRALRERGYIPITPDFTVNGTSNPDTLLPDIIRYIGTSGSCTLLLEDCWNSERMAILLGELESSLYCTANLSDYSFGETAQ